MTTTSALIPTTTRSSKLDCFNAASGLLFVVTMIGGWFFVAGAGKMPDLASAQGVYRAYQAPANAMLPTAICIMTVGFFFSLWFTGVLLGRMRQAEGAGPLTWVAAGGSISFITVFMVGLALGLADSLAARHGHGADAAAEYLIHLTSLLTGPTTGMCGAVFFAPLAIVIFERQIFPRWVGWFTIAALIGSMTPMLGFWSLTGPLNVGNGAIGVQTIAATWGIYGLVMSAVMLRELKDA